MQRRDLSAEEIAELLVKAKVHLRHLFESGHEILVSHFCYGATDQKILRSAWIPYSLTDGAVLVEQGEMGLAIVGNDGTTRATFEVVYTHAAPSVEHPEPWYELPAEFILDPHALVVGMRTRIQCVRRHDWPCGYCLATTAQWANLKNF
jgi:hypothetical protein